MIGETQQEMLERQRVKKEDISLKMEIANLETRLKAFSYPPNLGWGLMVLGYLAVFGILLPVYIIAKNKFSPLAEYIATLAFTVGIVGVFAYVVFQIRGLRRH